MKYNFIFDVDGTLTPSRQKIDGEFHKFFLEFCRNNLVFLVTGSDREKTLEQVTPEIYNSCHTVYNCLGNSVWRGNENIYSSDWIIPLAAKELLTHFLTESEFPLRTGEHFEHRQGLCNFSVVGRGATLEQRKQYVEFDREVKEREKIANYFNIMFPEFEAKVGGETGIDVFPRGLDKAQIIRDFDPEATLVFFGDRMDVAGNDYSLSQIVKQKDGVLHHVKNYIDTWDTLKNVYI